MDTYRYYGHSMSDPGSTYRTCDEIFNERQERDPIDRVRKLLLAHDIASEKELKLVDYLNGCLSVSQNEYLNHGKYLGTKFCDLETNFAALLRAKSLGVPQ
ncbi:hypothetical protein HN51_069758 [Arachis hypogaea]